jgi:hypothetical protein
METSVQRIIATFLVLMIAGNLPGGCASQTPVQPHRRPSVSTVEDQVRQIPVGALIEVRFTDKTKLRGSLSAVEADGFSFQAENATPGTLRKTAFSDVKSVGMIRRTHTPAVAWVVVGVIVAAVVIVVAIFAIERHNELGS